MVSWDRQRRRGVERWCEGDGITGNRRFGGTDWIPGRYCFGPGRTIWRCRLPREEDDFVAEMCPWLTLLRLGLVVETMVEDIFSLRTAKALPRGRKLPSLGSYDCSCSWIGATGQRAVACLLL